MASTTRGSAVRSKATSHEPVGAAERLGRALRRVRLTAGWTLEVAAERFGLDLKHLQKIEAGGQNVTLATLERIGAGLGFDLGSVLDAVVLGRAPKPRAASAVREPPPSPAPAARAPKQAPLAANAAVLVRVGARVSELRQLRGMTQRELAHRTGVTLGVVQRVEAGRIKKVSLRRLVRFAGALDVEIAALFEPPAREYRRVGRPNRVA